MLRRATSRFFSTTPRVVNRTGTLRAVNEKLSKGNKAFVEYIFTMPSWNIKFSKFHSAQNPYGHALVRYSNNYQDTIMNISGAKGAQLVNFYDPAKYLFDSTEDSGNQQGSILKRSFISVRIDGLNQKVIDDLHEYYQRLRKDNMVGDAEFSMFLHVITNKLRPWFHRSLRGNCATWTGNGLVDIGLINKTSHWPLVLWFKLFLNGLQRGLDVNVVSYKSVKFDSEPRGSLIYPFYWLRHSYERIWDISKFANVVVEPKVEGDQIKLDVRENPVAKQKWQEVYNYMKGIIRV
jgi:hypothetical protein